MEQRANIKFCTKLGKKFAETYKLLKNVYGDGCMSRTQVYMWFMRFKNGREDLNDDPKPGRPEARNHAELVEKVREIIAVDGNMTVKMLAEELNSTTFTIWTILTKDLGKRKVCARFVPHQLNKDQEIARVEYCKDIIETAENDQSFLDSIITGDETWCFKYDPKTKRQSAEWKSKGDPKPKKLRFQKSRIKTMLITFYDSKGIVHKEFVPEGQSVNGEYYLGVLHRLWSRILRVRTEYPVEKQLFLLHDNAPPHRSLKVREFLNKKQICVINHPPYSPDLSPCDYFLFPKLKIAMKGSFHEDVAAIQASVTQVLKDIPKDEFKKSMLALVNRARRCIDCNGTYFE